MLQWDWFRKREITITPKIQGQWSERSICASIHTPVEGRFRLLCVFLNQKVQSNTLPRPKSKTTRLPLSSPLTGGSKGTGMALNFCICCFPFLNQCFLSSHPFWQIFQSFIEQNVFWLIFFPVVIFTQSFVIRWINRWFKAASPEWYCYVNFIAFKRVHLSLFAPPPCLCQSWEAGPVDEMGMMMNNIKEGGVSLIGHEQPFTHDHFRRSFIRRCKNPVINEKVHALRALQSTLKVSRKSNMGSQVSSPSRHYQCQKISVCKHWMWTHYCTFDTFLYICTSLHMFLVHFYW